MTVFCSYLLCEYLPRSYEFLKCHQIDGQGDEKPFLLQQLAQEHINSLPKFRSLETAELKVYRCVQPLERQHQRAKERKAVEVAQSGALDSDDFPLLCEDDTFEGAARYDFIVVLETLRFTFVVFEKQSRSSYDYLCSGDVVAHPGDSAKTILDAARSRILRGEHPGDTVTINYLVLHEPEDPWKEKYKTALETKQLSSDLIGRGSSLILHPEDALRNIKNPNLVVVSNMTRTYKLQIQCALFKRESGSYLFAGCDRVDASSEQTVQFLHDTIREHIAKLWTHCKETAYDITVYEPREPFQAVYNKTPRDLRSLKLEDESLSPPYVLPFLPHLKLSELNADQTLIIVFEPPVQPAPSSLVDRLNRMSITKDAPSVVSKLDNYKDIQSKADERILDDRPSRDRFIAPIPLLYDGFGYFHDIRHGVRVPGEDDILELELWNEVNTLADEMSGLFGPEVDRRAVFFGHLQEVLWARRNPDEVYPSRIPDCEIISDGHINGAHGAIALCVECKNELSTMNCEPTAELVSHIAHSFKNRADRHAGLFNGWRVPALGVLQFGPYVQFWGVVWVGGMRAVHLTPMLPLTNPIGDEESRRNLFLAFKAASIVLCKIQTDTRKFLDHPPPRMTAQTCVFPSITEVDAFPASAQRTKIRFVLESRYDDIVGYRHLYHGHLVPSEEPVYIKFSQRYSIELHDFCASRGLAPKILGFQKLSGGWYALAMEKIDIVDPYWIKSFHELDAWKQSIKALVKDFHERDLVHGDLRMANFIFTKSQNPRKMLLVDFDWGGEAGKTLFPDGELAKELEVPNDRLDRPITKEHDERVLFNMFEALDSLAFR